MRKLAELTLVAVVTLVSLALAVGDDATPRRGSAHLTTGTIEPSLTPVDPSPMGVDPAFTQVDPSLRPAGPIEPSPVQAPVDPPLGGGAIAPIGVTPSTTTRRPIVSDPRVERLSTQVRIDVDGAQRVARVEVEELFRNNGSRLLEGDYLYPIPPGAVFTDFSLFMGEQELKGEMLSAPVARGIYEEIVRRKKDPALIELVGHGVLRARVFPIAAGETRRVILRYTQVLGRDGSLVRLRYPRIVGMLEPDGEGEIERSPMPVLGRQTAEPPFDLTINVSDAARFATPYSPTHRIEVRERDTDALEIRYAEEGEAARDFELFLPLREDAVGASVITHTLAGEPGFYMMLISPPAVARETRIPRDLTLVLDVSGSMSGDKMTQARAAMDQMIANLGSEDRFRVITFSSVVRQFRGDWSAADREQVDEARRWLAGIDADGSTNIQAALQEALRLGGAPGRLSQVVFLTDGKPTVGETSVEVIAELAGSMIEDERLFAFGLGHDVNTYLLDSLADGGRGSVSYVRPGEDVEEAVSSLTRKISFPALADLRVVDAPVMLEDGYPQSLPDLFYGEDLVLFGRYRGDGAGDLVLEGTRAGEVERLRFRVEFAAHDDGNAFIPKLWAARKAGVLTTQVRLHGASRELVEEIRQLGLRYGILTEYTSYLVEEPNMTLDDATMEQVLDRARQMEVAAEAQVGALAFGRAERARKAAVAASVREADEALRVRAYRPPPASAPVVTGADAMNEPGDRADLDGRTVLEGDTRHVVDRLFVVRDGAWTDLRFGDEKIVAVAAFSPAYFELVRLLPELKPFFALGERVIIAGDGIALEIVDTGLTSWGPGEIDSVLQAFGR